MQQQKQQRGLDISIGIFIYFVSSLGGIAIVKFLNYQYCYHSWISFAVLSRSTWILSFPFQLLLVHYNGRTTAKRKKQLWFCFSVTRRVLTMITWKQVQVYALIAIGLTLVELLNSFSMTILPGSLYVLLKGSDVGWSMFLSYLLLGKVYHKLQIFAAMLIMGGVGISILRIEDQNDDENGDSMTNTEVEDDSLQQELKASPSWFLSSWTIEDIPIIMAACSCLLGAFLNAFCAVWTERTLKQTLKEEEQKLLLPRKKEQWYTTQLPPPPIQQKQQSPSKLLLSNAYSMWTTFFSFCLLMIPISIVPLLTGSSYISGNALEEHQFWSSAIFNLDSLCKPSGMKKEDSISYNITTRANETVTMFDTATYTTATTTTGMTAMEETTGISVVVGSGTITTTTAMVVVCLLGCALTLSRFFERLSKHWICIRDSAMTFSIVQAGRRMSAVYVIAWLFGESISYSMWIGSFCCSVGFLLHYWYHTAPTNSHKNGRTTTINTTTVGNQSFVQQTEGQPAAIVELSTSSPIQNGNLQHQNYNSCSLESLSSSSAMSESSSSVSLSYISPLPLLSRNF